MNEAAEALLVPARMVNEYVYCPRLCYLEWVQGEFAHSADTLDGAFVHRRVDDPAGALPDPDEPADDLVVRSLTLASERLGAIAKLDIAEADDGRVVPVDYKRGRPPAGGPHDPERVQVCLQALILRDNGYACDEGVIYFAAAKRRVAVPLTPELIAQTEAAVAGARAMGEAGTIPPPLQDSPKCVGCSLAPICLPDEVQILREGPDLTPPRRLFPASDDAAPVYVQAQGAKVGKRDERLTVSVEGAVVSEARLIETSQLCLIGNVQVSTQAMRELCQREIPVCFFSTGGWFVGMTQGIGHKNVELRLAQYAAAGDPERALAAARRMVFGKVKNARTLLRRNAKRPVDPTLDELNRLALAAERATSIPSLLGFEGMAARVYFAAFSAMLVPGATAGPENFDFTGRNRRPPRDPINALLSFVYALLAKELTVTCAAVGFDPYLGLYPPDFRLRGELSPRA